MIALIAAYANHRVIGCHGKIPWNIPGEQTRFRELTTGNVVIMGRRTYEEIGRPLPNRKTILISSTQRVESECCTTVTSLAEALTVAGDRDVYISGGEQLYRAALPLADVLYLTTIEAEIEGDRFFPEINESEYDITKERHIEGKMPYTYWTYRRRPMGYQQALEYSRQIQAEQGIVLGLQPVQAMLARLGNPHKRTRFIHIAGTNGKGSTAAMLRTVLTEAGYRVGQFSSPAVFDPMEVWSIDGLPISERQYAQWMTRLRAHRDVMLRENLPVPTAFELDTILAFCYFAEQRVDFAILECGMGGAEDATNVIEETELCLLTAIGLDHMKFLGDTIAQIARQKCGIFRKQTPVVYQGQSIEAEETICCEAAALQCECVRTAVDQLHLVSSDWDGAKIEYRGQIWELSLEGTYQAYNAAQVIESAGILREKGYCISQEALQHGLQHTVWKGRFERICSNPLVLIDGAHNPNAAQELRRTIQAVLANRRIVMVMGVLADKEYSEVAQCVASLAEAVYTVTPDNPRALPAQELAHCVRRYCLDVCPVTISQAAEQAIRRAGTDGAVLAFGSLSYLKEFADAVRRQEENRHGAVKRNSEQSDIL